jgi:hypothetical protein
MLSDEPLQYLGQLEHAGEILLGENSVLTLGNYLIGPNCVLPTGGHARSWSPLSVHDFMKRTSIAQVTRVGYRTLAPYAHTLATYEGSMPTPMRCRGCAIPTPMTPRNRPSALTAHPPAPPRPPRGLLLRVVWRSATTPV